MFWALYRHRWVLYELVLRDVFIKYRGSVLGLLWTLITPLTFVAVYMIVFSFLLKINIPFYGVFLVSGLLPWQWFSTALQTGTNALVEGRTYLGNSVLPPVILVVVPILSNFVHFILSLLIALAIALPLGFHFHWPISHLGWAVVALPLLFAIQMLFTLALVLLTSTVNVFYRDMQQLVSILLMLAFYLIPIVYPLSVVPERFRTAVLADPMAALAVSYQAIFYRSAFPEWPVVLYALVSSLFLLSVARSVFNHYKDYFVEYV